jgi:hypothetical protein
VPGPSLSRPDANEHAFLESRRLHVADRVAREGPSRLRRSLHARQHKLALKLGLPEECFPETRVGDR